MLRFTRLMRSITIVDGAKALASEYHAAYPKANTFRCYRHLLPDLQKSKQGRHAAEKLKEIYKQPPTRQMEEVSVEAWVLTLLLLCTSLQNANLPPQRTQHAGCRCNTGAEIPQSSLPGAPSSI
eukprot:6179334-Pleurochrysis_carterae.AAC.1